MAVTSREIRAREALPGVILAVDYGRKRFGLALSDELGVISRPFAIWNRTNRRRDLARLRDLVREQSVRRIIVGLPLHADGRTSEMSEEAQAFAVRVQKTLGISVEMMDERLSSWEAQQLSPLGKSRGAKTIGQKISRGDALVDDRAAAVILRDYLERPEMSRRIEAMQRTSERSAAGPRASARSLAPTGRQARE